MTHLNDTMPTNLLATHRKYAHLTKEERVMIATLKSQGLSNRAIGRQLGVNHQTINNELKRGTVRQIRRQKFNGKTYDYPYHIYSYEAGQNIYLKCHQRSGRPRLYYRSKRFLQLADQLMLGEFDEHRYSPQAAIYKARDLMSDDSLIPKSVVTLYQWINDGVFRTSNLDLFEKTKRKHHQSHPQAKKCLGPNIAQRPQVADQRSEIGHWELDTIQGHKDGKDSVVLVMTDRFSRVNITRKIAGKTAHAVNQFFINLRFSELTQVHDHVFYADPCSPWERGSNEINNRFLRKEITKGQAVNDYSSAQIIATNNWMNHYPRAIFNGRSAMDVYCKAFYQETSRSHQPITNWSVLFISA
ncbi:IS30 family transposase [Limosilactobacillus reuteri]|uniref:IS30 family transposase n=1 Tax=Limosilactobacillus reuteri TaxID=1598 RepID=A0A1Y2UBN6_LIMRT|nr:IS30 family transposase [Limosilactobacillus reuteri]OTA80396.1 IS30 family transposase [Limosilactobacillus reuteri]